MLCRITDMHNKEVINICDGMRLGHVDDVEVDTCSAQLVSLVIYGRSGFLGLFWREEDIVISWKEIEVIGEHTILVNRPISSCAPEFGKRHRRSSILSGIFSSLYFKIG